MKRVLVIRHSISATGMGGIRFLRIARHLPEFGYDPVALICAGMAPEPIREHPPFELVEAKAVNLADVYARLRAPRAPRAAPEAAGGAKKTERARNISFTSAINRWCMIPDKEVTWLRPAVRAAAEYIRTHEVDLLYASVMPRTNALVAERLVRAFGLPCVIEYRDLWTDNMYHHLAQPTALHRGLHRRLERRALKSATRVTGVCRGIAERLEAEYGDVLKAPVALNYNFYDPTEYPVAKPYGDPDKRPFTISYVGSMYMSRRPETFFEGMRDFIDAEGLRPEAFRFRWVGPSFNIGAIEKLLDRLHLMPFIDAVGTLPHAEALEELVRSNVALMIQSPEDTIHIPGKLFEALGAGVPLLALAGPCEAREIIERVKGGVACRHDRVEVAAAIRTFWERRNAPWPYDRDARESFSARPAIGRLARLFDETIAAG